MQIAEYDADDFDRSRQSEQDKTLFVKFYNKSVQNKAETLKQGRPIFDERVYIDIRAPGNRESLYGGPATPQYINRFPEHYKAFMNRTTGELMQGTPLAEWPQITRSQVEEFSFFNVRTVEQLAAMSDEVAQKFMGMHGLRQKAKEFLARNGTKAEKEELEAKLAARDEQIAGLAAKLAELEAKLTTAPAPAKAKARGRAKAKVADAEPADSNS